MFRPVSPEAERARTIPGTHLNLGPRVSTSRPGELLARPYDPDLQAITHYSPVAIPMGAVTYVAHFGARGSEPFVGVLPWGTPSQSNAYKCIKFNAECDKGNKLYSNMI